MGILKANVSVHQTLDAILMTPALFVYHLQFTPMLGGSSTN